MHQLHDISGIGRPEKSKPRTTSSFKRRLSIGAEPLETGGTHFRVWAPRSRSVAVELWTGRKGSKPLVKELRREANGYFSGTIPEANAGYLYKFRLSSGSFPDPASRFQPEGPHGPSQIIDPESFRWSDSKWQGVSRRGQVIYEMHIGTFTREGTWRSAMEYLPELVRLGITIVEVMPIAEFPGHFGWGYDGVDLFAPTRLYGVADDCRAFVDYAHKLGLGVILDVVYNHVGPDGNYLKQFSDDYFTDRHWNEWGEALNFDGKNSGPVREFFIANAGYWIDEFHFDGLRLDATQQIFDASPVHVLREVSRNVREKARGRSTYIVAENETQHPRLARPDSRGGYGLDALWNDDFHHSARVALTGHNEAYYSEYKGTPQEFISAVKWGYLYQGQWYSWQNKTRGKPGLDLEPDRFVTFLQNHDQIANSLRGYRLHQLANAGELRAMIALLLLGPGTPMLFQGEEFAASAPFLYFADHNPELAKLVAKGRKEFLQQFKTIACPEADACIKDPGAQETFLACKLDHSERKKNKETYTLYKELLHFRREDPVFSNPKKHGIDGAVLGPQAFVLRFFGDNNDDRVLIINLGLDLPLQPWPEPLLAPIENSKWALKWSSESVCYGGCGTPPFEEERNWLIPGKCALVFAAEPLPKRNGKNRPKNKSHASRR